VLNSRTYDAAVQGPGRTPLKDLFARKGIQFGTSMGGSTVGSPYLYHPAFHLRRECNVFTMDGNGMAGQTQAVEGVWNFSNCTTNLTFAAANNLELHHGGHLIWHTGEPSWYNNYTTASGLRGKLRQHIEATVTGPLSVHKSWNMSNEVIATWNNNPGGWRTTRYYTTFGANWPTEFYIYTSTLTNAELIWNENHAIERADDSAFNANKAAIITALNAGAPINTYGMQMHLNGTSDASGAQMVDRLNQIAALGLDIRISEFDIYDGDNLWPTLATRRANQVAYVESRLGPIVNQVPRLKSFITWDCSDTHSWLTWYLNARNDGQPREFLPVGTNGLVKKEWWEMFDRITS
jgi:GH35 family endo-1,4-beta-xylanase